MVANQKVEYVGKLIRQLRRQRNLTQTQLGANRYSKSYVSAVEKSMIRPSSAALQFFAQQLEQSSDYFTTLLESTEEAKQGAVIPSSLELGSQFLQDQGFSLLYLLMQHAEPFSSQMTKELPTLAPEALAALPTSKQSYYSLLEGLTALTKQEYEKAVQALERALPLAPAQLRPMGLDALGQYYHLTQSYSIALHFHLRALAALQHMDAQEVKNSLFFSIALHCGEDYRTLSDYRQAQAMYEQARNHLRAEHEMKNAALLYLGLGYCTYGLTYQAAAQMPEAKEQALSGEMERGFQQAISYMVQSRSIFQVSSDRLGEISARLLQTVAQLDFIRRYRQSAQSIGATFAAASFSLLENAEEQCRQVLISWHDWLNQKEGRTSNDAPVYEALAHLVQIFIQRAIIARLRGQDSNALRERTYAAYVCQQVLDTLAKPIFPGKLIQEILSLRREDSLPDSPSLPRLPNVSLESSAYHQRFTGLVEVYAAAMEIAEELGYTGVSSDYKQDCYRQADRCSQTAFALAYRVVAAHQRDAGYLARCRQRYAYLLEERLAVSPEDREETSNIMVALLKEGPVQHQTTLI